MSRKGVIEHKVTEQRTHQESKRSWSGTIQCSCQWDGEVSDHPDDQSAGIGLQAVWYLHTLDWQPAPKRPTARRAARRKRTASASSSSVASA